MRVEGLSANKTSHFSVIMEVKLLPHLFFLVSFLDHPENPTISEQIFQVAPTFIMVDIQNAAGDAEEYLKVFVHYDLHKYAHLTFSLTANIETEEWI